MYDQRIDKSEQTVSDTLHQSSAGLAAKCNLDRIIRYYLFKSLTVLAI